MVGSAYLVKSTPPRAFSISFQYFADMFHTLKMSIKIYNDEKIIFDKFTLFFIIVIFEHCLYTIMVGSEYFVKSTPLRAFSVSFKFFVDLFQIYFRCA